MNQPVQESFMTLKRGLKKWMLTIDTLADHEEVKAEDIADDDLEDEPEPEE